MSIHLDGEAIRLLRQRLGYSRARFAELTGVSERTLGRIENGELLANHPGTGAEIARVLKCNLEAILKKGPPPAPPKAPARQKAPAPTSPPPDLSTMRTMVLPAAAAFPPRAAPSRDAPTGSVHNPALLPKAPLLHFSAAFRAEQGKHFAFMGWVQGLSELTNLERIALGCAQRGVGALFDVQVRAGPASSTIALFTNDAARTSALTDAARSRQVHRFVVQLVVVETSADHKTLNDPTDLAAHDFRRDWRGFRWADRKTPVWWALQLALAEPA